MELSDLESRGASCEDLFVDRKDTGCNQCLLECLCLAYLGMHTVGFRGLSRGGIEEHRHDQHLQLHQGHHHSRMIRVVATLMTWT
jgi:hypothetical protein